MSSEEIVVVTSKDKPVKEKEGVRVIDIDSEEGRKLAGNVGIDDLPQAFVVKKSACQVVKRDDAFVAVCENKEVKLEQDEECPGCTQAIAVGWSLNYIKNIESDKADQMHKKFFDGEMSAEEVLDRCEAIASEKNDAKLADTIRYLKELSHKPMSELKEIAE